MNMEELSIFITEIQKKVVNFSHKMDKIESKLDHQSKVLSEISATLKTVNFRRYIYPEKEIMDESYMKKQNDKNHSDLEVVKYSEAAKKAKPDSPLSRSAKNPISLLNELWVGAKFEVVEKTGPAHAPTFKMSVTINGETFYATGCTKKAAKIKVAQLALASNFLEDSGAEEVPKGATMLLNEMYRNVQYDCEEVGGSASSRYRVTITLGDDKFYGSGSSKKRAKNKAAIAVLSQLKFNSMLKTFPNPIKLDEAQDLAEHISTLIRAKFESLTCKDLFLSRLRVLAGIVMVREGRCEVLSVATGTKCVSGEYLSMKGGALNDMHAEILARRCLVRYFYDQLEAVALGEDSVFVQRDDGKGYRLKTGLDFHLFISTAPCGDARIFSLQEEDDEDRHPNRICRGLLRTKIEDGEGSIPVSGACRQTWDGVLQGNRLLTMTCSDKICRWNVVGLQGALLSHFVEPVYLKSVVLGNLFHESHLTRALYGRVKNKLPRLPSPYCLNRPSIHRLMVPETRQASNSTNFSVIWSYGDTEPEIIDTNIGKPELGVSKFCKQELGKRFASLLGRISSITSVETGNFVSYGAAKEAAHAYEEAKESLSKTFVAAGLGSWVSKPLEQDEFSLREN